ncbi:MAG: tRNA uridine-5-carboxymethylaminomethyl(34) synthesis GTPase MnmE [Planktomarina sp.]
MANTTIFARATAPGRAGVSIIRVSGPDAWVGCAKICKIPKPGQFLLSKVYSVNGDLLDEALILSFEKGKSFTGEQTIEIQCHGSDAVVVSLLQTLRDIGFQHAEAGEFTRRALENGQMSLLEVEALADLIDAETETQHRQAMAGFSGKLRDQVQDWDNNLLELRGLIEAIIDFSDEELPDDISDDIQSRISDLINKIEGVLQKSQSSEIIRSGFRVAIVGPPNAGKSTLLNALAGSEVAITSGIPGTTRDVVTAKLNIAGIPVEFGDTAGIRQTDDEIEKIGIERGKDFAKLSNIEIILCDNEEDIQNNIKNTNKLYKLAKDDVGSSEYGISGKSGYGVDTLIAEIEGIIQKQGSTESVLFRQRHHDAAQSLLTLLKEVQNSFESEQEIEISAAIVFEARRQIDFLLGRSDIENVLGKIFSSFCIGK